MNENKEAEVKQEEFEQKDLVDIVKENDFTDEEAERQEELEKEIARNNLKNISLTETDIHMFGDRLVISQIVQLIAYIRHAVKNNLQTEIKVKIGNTVVNSELMFDVNGCQVPDLRVQSEAEIN